MRRKVSLLPPAVLLAVLFVAGCGLPGSGGSVDADTGLPSLTIETSGGEEVEVWVEIADEREEQVRGLMERTDLPEDQGMLFVFEDERPRSFWMKNTFIPLSIAYIDSDGRIVDIQQMEPVDQDRTVPDAALPRYVSAEPARYALEVNRGFFEERGVEVGDTVDVPE